MSEDDQPIPEGMRKYTMLGMTIVGPEGLPDEFVASVMEGMVRVGALVFDPATQTISPNPDMSDDTIRGMTIAMDDSFNVGRASLMDDEQVKKDLGIHTTRIDKSSSINENVEKMRRNRRK